MRTILLKNKKGISELVSYVLLIIIAISISVGVYTWLRSYMPSEKERQKCPEEATLIISDYECVDIPNYGKFLRLKIENRGLFNLDGFYIRASNDSSKLPTTNLNTIDVPEIEVIPGRYFANLTTGSKILANFTYGNLTTIRRVQIQAIYNVTICTNIVDIRLEGC